MGVDVQPVWLIIERGFKVLVEFPAENRIGVHFRVHNSGEAREWLVRSSGIVEGGRAISRSVHLVAEVSQAGERAVCRLGGIVCRYGAGGGELSLWTCKKTMSA